MFIDDLPEIPGVTSLGNVREDELDGSPLGLLTLPWSRLGSIAFYLFVAYASQLCFFAVLGMGWSWGYTHKYNGTFSQWSYTPHLTLGSNTLYVKAGQTVLVHYKQQVERGCLSTFLSPAFGMPFHTPNSYGRLTGSEGNLALVSPTPGWVKIDVYPSFGCNSQELGQLRENFGQYHEAAKIGYQLSWRATF
jgi:hypothetical protein